MEKQLVPEKVLAEATSILFVTHFAIGDYLYWQTYFTAFHRAYPHIKIHVFVDELRRTWKWWRWPALKKYSLYDWLEQSPFIEKVYKNSYSPWAALQSWLHARAQQYPIVVSLATLRTGRYALLARFMGHKAFVVGLINKKKSLTNIFYRLLDATSFFGGELMASGYHITDCYARIFEDFFGISVLDRRPFLAVPRVWQTNAKLMLLKWGLVSAAQGRSDRPRIVFVNIFAKDRKRCWSIDAAIDLIRALQMQDTFPDTYFIFNALPGNVAMMKKKIDIKGLRNVIIFSAHRHFFQLPAIIELCDLVISVETAVMHIASAVHVPVLALMRTKNPEWAPWDKNNAKIITAAQRQDWVKHISAAPVVTAVKDFLRPSTLRF
jgi:heptosyltransferase III